MSDIHTFISIREAESLRKKLFWVSSLRILSILALMGGSVSLLEGANLSTLVHIRQTLMLTGFVSLIPAFLYFPLIYSLRVLRGLVAVGYVQIVQDMAFAALLVMVTGGTSSAFTFFFSLNVIIAGILLFRKGTIFAVILAYALMVVMALVETQVIPVPAWIMMFVLPLSSSSVLYNLTINIVALTSIAILSSYLSEQIRQADIQKEEMRLDLEDLRALHEHILTSLNSGLITCNRKWDIVYMNPAGIKMLGLDRKNYRGKHLPSLVPGLGSHLKQPERSFELKIETNDGAKKVMSFRISPLRPMQQEIPGYVVLFDDITRLKDLESRMLAEHRLVTIGKLSAVVAHEIRNPLASISGVMQMLSSNDRLTDQEKRLVDIVIREADHLNKWITDLLNYAKPTKSTMVPLNVCALCERTREMFVLDEDLKDIQVDMSCREGWILGNNDRLGQVMLNLLKNAAEAIRDAGISPGIIRITAAPDGGNIVCRFEDNGPGISAKNREQLFQPFYTTKKKGTGLGLAVVEQIVMEHGGWIKVKDSELGGACFEISMTEVPGPVLSEKSNA